MLKVISYMFNILDYILFDFWTHILHVLFNIAPQTNMKILSYERKMLENVTDCHD